MSQAILLGDVTTKIGSGATPRGGANSYLKNGPVALIRSQNVRDNGFDYSGLAYINMEQAHKLKNVEVKEGDVLVNITGDSVARIGCVPADVLPARVNQHVAIIRTKKNELDSDFLYYFLVEPGMKNFLLTMASTGATRNALTKNQLERLKLKLPGLDMQKKISSILKVLDEKIILNRRTNETLEKIGQALFRHYFIDNPEAKTWPKKPLDEIAEFLNGAAMQKFPAEDPSDSLPVIKIREMSAGITDNTDRATKDIPEKYLVKDGDMLFSWSGTLIVKIWTDGDGALNQHLFKVTSEKYTQWFYYLWTKYHLGNFIETAAGKATTMGHIQRHHLSEAQVAVPNDSELAKFDRLFSSVHELQIKNSVQNRELADLRDSLLPRLISGKTEVK